MTSVYIHIRGEERSWLLQCWFIVHFNIVLSKQNVQDSKWIWIWYMHFSCITSFFLMQPTFFSPLRVPQCFCVHVPVPDWNEKSFKAQKRREKIYKNRTPSEGGLGNLWNAHVPDAWGHACSELCFIWNNSFLPRGMNYFKRNTVWCMRNLKHQAHVPNCVSFEIPVSRAHYSNDNEVSLKVAICIFFFILGRNSSCVDCD